jgi:hypothetical protein
MKRTFSAMAAVIAATPLIAEANSRSYEAGYAVGSYAAWVLDQYGPYLRLAALVGAICWIWSIRVKARRRRDSDARHEAES